MPSQVVQRTIPSSAILPQTAIQKNERQFLIVFSNGFGILMTGTVSFGFMDLPAPANQPLHRLLQSTAVKPRKWQPAFSFLARGRSAIQLIIFGPQLHSKMHKVCQSFTMRSAALLRKLLIFFTNP